MKASSLVAGRSFLVLSLVGLFSVSFALPLFFGLRAAAYILHNKSASESEVPDQFPNSIAILSDDARIEIDPAPELDPVSGRDFLFVGWFRVRKLPTEGQRMILMSKYSVDSPNREGYVLALSREVDSIRPSVYWEDMAGKGGWYTFDEIPLLPRSWVLLALSFRGGKYLGLHGAVIGATGKSEITLLGGYDLGEEILAASASPLLLGSVGGDGFRGSIGPFGIFRKGDLSESLSALLDQFVRFPTEVPAMFSDPDVQLWVPGGDKDVSRNSFPVRLTGRARERDRAAKR